MWVAQPQPHRSHRFVFQDGGRSVPVDRFHIPGVTRQARSMPMNTCPHASTALVFTVVVCLVVPYVPCFAQTDTRVASDLPRSSETAVSAYQAGPGPSHEGTPLPQNLIVTKIYGPIVEVMRMRSPTFRRQCARIAAARHLLIEIKPEPPRGAGYPAGFTEIRRYQHGRMIADVRVPTSYRAPEIIAHELEHVLEQLDGVDLPAKATLPSSGVRLCKCGGAMTFETRRAVSVGLRVAREVERG